VKAQVLQGLALGVGFAVGTAVVNVLLQMVFFGVLRVLSFGQ
jgi:hypothetical protein